MLLPLILTATNCSGTAFWSWRPHNSTAVIYSLGSSPTLTIASPVHGVYMLGCQTACKPTPAWASQVIVYPSVGTLSLSSNGPLNAGQTLNLQATASNVAYTSAITYAWSGPNGFTSAAQNPSIANITVAGSGTYTVVVSNGYCSSTQTIDVVVSLAGCTTATVATSTTTNPVVMPGLAFTDKNNVVSTTFLKPTTVLPTGTQTIEGVQSITYLDGFGRSLQTVINGVSPLGKDIIQPYFYDGYGRATKSYLPYTSAFTNGSYRATAFAEQTAFYNTQKGDANAFAETILENAPIDILKKQGFVGTAWQTNTTATIKADYKHSLETSIRKFTGDDATGWWAIGTYSPNELMIAETKDIDNNIVEEFSDFSGNVVCKRVSNPAKTTSYITYFAYDGFGRNAITFPPSASSNLTLALVQNGNLLPSNTNTVKDLIFYNVFDKRGRIIKKKVPDAALEEFVYDDLDQLVLYRNGLHAATSTWLYTKYDELGRVHSTGTYASASAQSTLQTAVNTQYATTMAFGAAAFPTTGFTEQNRNYYDSYNNVAQLNGTTSATPAPLNQPNATTNVNGKLIATTEKIIVPTGAVVLTKTEIKSVFYYDKLGNALQTITEDHLGKLIVSNVKQDFAGRAEIVEELVGGTYTTAATTKVTLCQKYDFGSRLKAIYQQINATPMELVGRYTYNELGEMTTKTQGCEVQTIGYKFDIQGKLTDINEVNTTNLKNQKKFFGEKIVYNLNGSIQKTDWASLAATATTAPAPPPMRSYAFSYDFMQQQTAATYTGGVAGENFSTTTTYATNGSGNITSLTRSRGAVIEDNLLYTYNISSNRLAKVADANTTGTAAGWFKDGTNGTANDYAYDAAGNMTADANKGIASIAYNYLNLPATITFTNGTKNFYYYTAGGDKLRRVSSIGATGATDYVGSMVFKTITNVTTLEFIPTPEGRATPQAAGAFRYEYQTTDHIGNLRATYHKTAGATDPILLQQNHYDPWGVNLTDIETNDPNGDRYQYNGGSEKTTTPTGGYDYDTDFRQYDPQTGRFKAIDALADLYGGISPYSFGFNSPTNFNDPTGLSPGDWWDDFTSLFTKKETYTGFGKHYVTVSPPKAPAAASNTVKSGGGGNGVNTTAGVINGAAVVINIATKVSATRATAALKVASGSSNTSGSTVQARDVGTISAYKPNLAEQLSDYITASNEPGSYVARVLYNIVDDAYVLGTQVVTGNPRRMSSNSVTKNEQLKASVGTIVNLAFGSITKGVSSVETSTILGSDAVTMRNASRMVAEKGTHQLLVHGHYKKFIINGVITSPKTVARTMLKSGYKSGTPIRCISCHTGNFDNGAAYELSRYLKSPVIAPTDNVTVLQGGKYLIDNKGVWKTFK